ncbi:hypothetical protein WJX73_008864 [Symbiochloris irregularis]|uniref:Uncharacterized protein n=1 Tax=Symbiochloris irregularis TaxID=706552 RepID=A0AAW1PVE5_9CHLO
MPQKNKILGRPWPQFSVEDLRLLLLDMRVDTHNVDTTDLPSLTALLIRTLHKVQEFYMFLKPKQLITPSDLPRCPSDMENFQSAFLLACGPDEMMKAFLGGAANDLSDLSPYLQYRTQFGRLAQCHGKDKVSTLILYDETSQVSIMLIIRGLRKAYEDIPLMEVQFLCMTELNDPHECWQEMMDAVEATMEGGNKWMSLKIRLLNAMLVKEMLLSNAAMLTPDARAVRS